MPTKQKKTSTSFSEYFSYDVPECARHIPQPEHFDEISPSIKKRIYDTLFAPGVEGSTKSLKDNGLAGWLMWVFFNPKGVMDRLPYLALTFTLIVLGLLLFTIIQKILPGDAASHQLHLPGNKDSLLQLALLCLLALFQTALDIKRFRSIGLPFLLGILKGALLISFFVFASPLFTDELNRTTCMNLAGAPVIFFTLILLIIPSRAMRDNYIDLTAEKIRKRKEMDRYWALVREAEKEAQANASKSSNGI